MKKKVGVALAVLLLSAAVIAGGIYLHSRSEAPQTTEEAKEVPLQMVVFKIGKADAILIRIGDQTILIDTGEDEDAGEVLEYLHGEGISRIDAIILSHFDKDHVGGADKLLESIEIGSIYQPDYVKDGRQYEEYVRRVENSGIEPVVVTERLRLSYQDTEVVIYPPGKTTYEEENDYSLAVEVVHGVNRFLFTGDAEEERMKELMSGVVSENSAYSFLKMPHHGRWETNTEAFIQAVQPAYAVITCSVKNPPDEETLAALLKEHVKVYLTMDGDIHVESDGSSISVWQ